MDASALGTLILAGAAIVIGDAVRRAVPLLARYNVPGPVIGGLCASMLWMAARRLTGTQATLNDVFREPLQNAFFATIGFGASFGLLRRGGSLLVGLLALTLVGGVLQNLLGAALAPVFNQSPLFGVLCGSVTLMGGPATGLAFAPAFVDAGVTGADAVALASAMTGIVAAGMLAAPLGTVLLEGATLRSDSSPPNLPETQLTPAVEYDAPSGDARGVAYAVILIAGAVALGAMLSRWLASQGFTLPSYMGAMIVAVTARGVSDACRWRGFPWVALERTGGVALSFFLAIALMTLDLRLLAGVVVPIAGLVTVQVVAMAALCRWAIFPMLGGHRDAAVATAGFFGFMIGTTPVAVAAMDSLVRRYGPAPRALLVVPVVGAMLLDFINAVLIQASIELVA